MEIYYLGGGTCCGKSTATELLREKYGLRLFKQDEYLFDYLEQLAKAGNEIAAKQLGQSMEEMWLGASAAEMCAEEMQLYAAMLPLSQAAIAALPGQGDILAEGAVFCLLLCIRPVWTSGTTPALYPHQILGTANMPSGHGSANI